MDLTIEYGFDVTTTTGARQWARIANPRPRKIASAGQYVGICRRMDPTLSTVDGHLIAVGFNHVPPSEWVHGRRTDEESPRRLSDFVTYWNETQMRPTTVGSSHNADPETAFAFFTARIPAALAKRLPDSDWPSAIERNGLPSVSRVAALAALAKKLHKASIPRLSHRRIRDLLRFDGATLRAAFPDFVTLRIDWARLREIDAYVRTNREELRSRKIKASDWHEESVRLALLINIPVSQDMTDLIKAWHSSIRQDSEQEYLLDMRFAPCPDRWLEALSTGVRVTRATVDAVVQDRRAACEDWPLGIPEVVLGERHFSSYVAVIAANGAKVHCHAPSIILADKGATVHAHPDSLVVSRGAVVYGGTLIPERGSFTAEQRIAIAKFVKDQFYCTELERAVLRDRLICDSYPELDKPRQAKIVLGASPVDLSDGVLSRREAHEWCMEGAPPVIPWLLRDTPSLEGKYARSAKIARWLADVHDRGAWGQLTKRRTFHGPAGASITRTFMSILDEIQDADLVEEQATKVEVAFARAAERQARIHEARNKDSGMVLCRANWIPPRGVRILSTPRDLYTEGQEMSHCVGSYGPAVLNGQSIILSISVNGHRSTAEISPDRKTVFQHLGPSNSEPHPDCVKVLQGVVRHEN
jgi:hypothetical protein